MLLSPSNRSLVNCNLAPHRLALLDHSSWDSQVSTPVTRSLWVLRGSRTEKKTKNNNNNNNNNNKLWRTRRRRSSLWKRCRHTTTPGIAGWSSAGRFMLLPSSLKSTQEATKSCSPPLGRMPPTTSKMWVTAPVREP